MSNIHSLRQAFRFHDRLTIWEQEVVALIAFEATQRGLQVSILDEAYEPICSRRSHPQEILDHTGHTSRDYLTVHGPHGDRLGYLALDYGNEPGVTLADHTEPNVQLVPSDGHLRAIIDAVDALQKAQADHYFQIA